MKGIAFISEHVHKNKYPGIRAILNKLTEKNDGWTLVKNLINDEPFFEEVFDPGSETEVKFLPFNDSTELKKWQIDEIGLLIIHHANEDSCKFYIDMCPGVPVVFFSDGSVEKKDSTLSEIKKASIDIKKVIFINQFGSKISNLPFWFNLWVSEYNCDPNQFRLTKNALLYGDTYERDELRQLSGDLLKHFTSFNLLIQGYLAIHDWGEKKIDGIKWPEYCQQHNILQTAKTKELAIHFTQLKNLIRPPKLAESSEHYWFDECADEFLSESLFSTENDLLWKRIIKNAQEREPDLSCLMSSSKSTLHSLWNLLGSHYATRAEERQQYFDLLPERWKWDYSNQHWYEAKVFDGGNDKILEIFHNSQKEFMWTIEKINYYLK